MSNGFVRVLSLLAPFALVGAPVRAADPPPAKTPEEALKLYQQELRAGRLEASLQYVSTPRRPVWQATVGMVRAAQTFEDALDSKFGKEAGRRRMFDPQADARAVKRVEVRSKSAEKFGVHLTVWKTRAGPDGKDRVSEEKFFAVEDETGWRLQLPLPFGGTRTSPATRKGADGSTVTVTVVEHLADTPTAKQEAFIKAKVARTTATFTELAREVAAGKYATRKEALDALRARLK